MNKYTKKQLELIRRINDNFELIEVEKNWIEVAKSYCENVDNEEYFIFKMGLLLDVINKHSLKLYNNTEDLLCNLRSLL